MNPVKAAEGYRTYIIGAIMVLNALYTLFTGDVVPTFDHPVTPGGTDVLVGGGLGAGLMTLRAAVFEIGKRLDTVVKSIVPPSP